MAEIWQLVSEMTQPTRRRSKLSVSQIAERLRVPASTLYQYGEPEKLRLPADLIAALTAITGDTLLIEALAEACGGTFVPLSNAALEQVDAGKACREFGELMTALGTALEDGTITAQELSDIKKEANDAIHAIQCAVAKAERSHLLNKQQPANPIGVM